MEQPKLKIEVLNTADLVPYANNAKKHPDWQIAQIVASIKQFGNCDPIAVWHNADGEPEIVEGHGRLLALRELGIDKCPCVILDHLDDEARRAYTHVHNQLTMNTEMDDDAIQREIEELYEFDWSGFGFHIKPLVEEFDEASIEEPDVPDEVKTRVKRGEVWQLGTHRLMCGSSTDANDIQKLAGGNISITADRPSIQYRIRRGHLGYFVTFPALIPPTLYR